MNLEILTPEKKLYSGEVYVVQMPGISGLEVLQTLRARRVRAEVVMLTGHGTDESTSDEEESERGSRRRTRGAA